MRLPMSVIPVWARPREWRPAAADSWDRQLSVTPDLNSSDHSIRGLRIFFKPPLDFAEVFEFNV